MEELIAFCESGSRTISIPRDWSEVDKAKEFLLSKGYVADLSSEDEDLDGITFELPRAAPSPTPLSFPHTPPQPQYAPLKKQRSDVADSSMGWKPFPAFQFDTSKLPAEQRLGPKVCVPGLDKEQNLSCTLLVQPYVKSDECQLYVKLHVEKLNVGVKHTDFLYGKRDQGRLGYYPYFVKVNLEPVLVDGEDVVSVPVYLTQSEAKVEAETSVVRRTDATTIALQVGYGPFSASIDHAISKERLVKVEGPTCLVAIEEVERANLAGFEWCILRWEDGGKYRADKPQSGFVVRTRKLPLENRGNAALLKDFPQVVWRFDRRSVTEERLKFRITIQVEMHLIWFSGVIVKSLGCHTAGYQFANLWSLKGK